MTDDPHNQELRQRLYSRYEKKQTSFTTLFTALITFAVIFFAFVLLPYVVLEHLQDSLDARSAELADAIAAGHAELETTAIEALNQQTALGRLGEALATEGTRLNTAQAELARLTATLDEINAAQQANTEEQLQLEASREALMRARSALGQFELDQGAQVSELRAFLLDLQPRWERSELQTNAACPDPEPDRLVGCLVQIQVEGQIDSIFGTIQDSVVAPLANVTPATADEISSRLTALRHDIRKQQLLDPNFWRTVSGKELFFTDMEEGLNPVVEDIVAAVQSKAEELETRAQDLNRRAAALVETQTELGERVGVIEARRAALGQRRDELATTLERLSAEQETAQQAQEELAEAIRKLEVEEKGLGAEQDTNRAELSKIEKRLSSIQSPFGTLPIGLSDGILAYPIVVAVGFVICGFLTIDAIRLRNELRATWRRWDPKASVLDDSRVALMAPLWLEPGGRSPRMLLRAVVFNLPVVLFLGGVALIAYAWIVSEAPLGGRATQAAYALLYLASSAAMVIVATALWRRWLTTEA